MCTICDIEVQNDPAQLQFAPADNPSKPWWRVQIESVWSKTPHFVDVQGSDNFDALRAATDQNKHASSAKIVKRYQPGEKLLGNW